MAQRPKRVIKPVPHSPTALDARQLALQEQERKILEKVERAEKLIKDAPRIAEERQRVQREELIRRASVTDKRRRSISALPDHRHTLDTIVGAPAQHRRMRRERRQGRLTFFMLLITLAAAIFYLYYTVTQG